MTQYFFIYFCREETKKVISKLIKKLTESVVLVEERIENLTSLFPLQYLTIFEQMIKIKNEMLTNYFYIQTF